MDDDENPRMTFGQAVYDDDGEKLGTVRGFDQHGFYVTTDEGIEGLSVEHLRSGHELGQAELLWRCYECGEVGDLSDDFPEECPNCGASREELYYYQED